MSKLITSSLILLVLVQPLMADQQVALENKLKDYFNQVVVKVKRAEDPADKREILDDAFERISRALDTGERIPGISEEDRSCLVSFRTVIQEKRDELNGVNGFDRIADTELNDFAGYSQQDFEQAAKTVTISVTTLLLIVIIALLLN